MQPLLLDIGWTELMVIGVVALIVVGPKDLPMMFRRVGQFVGRARGMAREFQRAMDEAADETGVKDIGQSIKKATDVDLGVGDMTEGLQGNNYVPGFGSDDKKKPAEDPVKAANAAAEAQGKEFSKAQSEAKEAEEPAKEKPAAKKKPAKKAPAKPAASKKAPAKPAASKKAPAKSTTAKKASAKKAAKKETS